MEHTVNIDQWLNVGKLKSIYHNGENGIVMYIPTRTRTCIYGYTLHTTTQSHTGFDHNATKCVRCHIKIYCEWMTLCIWLCLTYVWLSLFHTPEKVTTWKIGFMCVRVGFLLYQTLFTFGFVCFFLFLFSFYCCPLGNAINIGLCR